MLNYLLRSSHCSTRLDEAILSVELMFKSSVLILGTHSKGGKILAFLYEKPPWYMKHKNWDGISKQRCQISVVVPSVSCAPSPRRSPVGHTI